MPAASSVFSNLGASQANSNHEFVCLRPRNPPTGPENGHFLASLNLFDSSNTAVEATSAMAVSSAAQQQNMAKEMSIQLEPSTAKGSEA